MTKTTLKKSLLIIAIAIIPMTFFGQEEPTPSNYWMIGIEGGGTQLFGDNQAWKLDQTSWDAGIFAGYVFQNSAYLYGNLGYATLNGKYENVWHVDECNAFYANINIGYDVMQLFKLRADRVFGIVPHAGWGVINHRSKTVYENGTVVQTGYSDATPGGGIDSRRNAFQLPLGVNFVFNFTKHFRLNIDAVSNMVATDMLDARRSGKKDDYYGQVNLGLAYKFGYKDIKPCPVCPEDELNECREALQQAQDELEQCRKDKAAADEAARRAQEAAAAATAAAARAAEKATPEYEAKDMHLTFAMGKAEVENTPANKAELKKISNDIDNGREISEIKVVGHASPEGNAKFNEKLSKDRADATAKFIKEGLGEQSRGIAFTTEGKGADWDGFIEEIENSTINNKAEIVNELKNADDKVATLKKLAAKYPELTELYPELRQTEILIK